LGIAYTQLPAGPWGNSTTAAPLKNSGHFCALSHIQWAASPQEKMAHGYGRKVIIIYIFYSKCDIDD
jgi:hypothetical protein